MDKPTTNNTENEENKDSLNDNLSFFTSSYDQTTDLNNKIRNDFITYCLSFLQDDDEARQCVQLVWKKYLQSVGDVTMLSAFFDTLPYHIKASILPKYQDEITQWCENIFHIKSNFLLCLTYYSETFHRVIRYAFKNLQYKKAIIYIPTDFDLNIKIDLTSSISNIKFEHISNDKSPNDMINLNQLEQLIQRDIHDLHSYPFMVIANAGSALFGHCDQLNKLKKLCEKYDIWLHVVGDLLGSLALLPKIQENINISCDSLTIDIMKLFGIQNLPYLTFFLRSTNEKKLNDNKQVSSSFSQPIDDYILHNPSISFLTVWAISQRCSKENIFDHMKQSFHFTELLYKSFKQINTLQILDDDNEQELITYRSICSGDAPDELLPKSVIVFRFQPNHTSQNENANDLNEYLDLLNIWLYDKLSQQYPKINLDLLQTVHFQIDKNENTKENSNPINALRFAPLEHLLDTINQNDIQSFIEDVQNYIEILLATMSAHLNLSSIVKQHENLVSVPLSKWAGIGAIRYIPSHINLSELNQTSVYEINRIQAELVRNLQSNDAAFSLGGEPNENDSMFFLRLGMIRKSDDLDVLLRKISDSGKETEVSLKYVEDMAEKIKTGIAKVQKDLQEENLHLLAEEGLLRQLPIVSNFISWWSPLNNTSTLIKGRSFDLNSGSVESTEEIYRHRMQIKKQYAHAPTHNESEPTTPSNTNSTEENTDK